MKTASWILLLYPLSPNQISFQAPHKHNFQEPIRKTCLFFFFLLILFICYFLKFVILWDYNFSPRTYSVILFLCCLYEWSHFCTALFSFLFVGVSSNSIRDFLFLFLWSCLIYMCVCVFKTSKNVVKKKW